MLTMLAALSLSATPVLLKDLEPGAAIDSESYLEVDTGADPNLLVVNNTFWGTELFTILDGRRTLVADLCPGRCSSDPRQLTRLGAKVLFLANQDGTDGLPQLWVTNGFTQDTVMLADQVVLSPRLTALEGQLVFNRLGEIWLTDGTPAGTAPLAWGKGRTVVSVQATPQHRFFATRKATGGCDLFVSGTDVRQATPQPMPAPSEDCGPLATMGERAFLSFTTGVWRFDGTGASAALIDAAGRGPVRAGPALFFFSFGTGTLSLFTSTGEPGTTTPLGTVSSEGLRQTISVGPRILYVVVDAAGRAHLHASDGTPGGTVEIATADAALALVAVGPVAYAVVKNGTKLELIETDGTKSGTVVVQGIHPAAPAPSHVSVTGHTQALAFVGTVVSETGAFRLRPGEDPETVFAQPGNPRDSASQPPVVIGAQAFFSAGGRVYRTDGTPDASVEIASGVLVGRVRDRLLVVDADHLASVGFDGGDARALHSAADAVAVNFGATALVAARAGASGVSTLLLTDGSGDGGTTEVRTLGPGPLSAPMALDTGEAVFPIGDTLWFTNGSALATGGLPVPHLTQVVPGPGFVWAFTGDFRILRVSPQGTLVVHAAAADTTYLAAGAALGDQLYFVVFRLGVSELWRADANGSRLLATRTLMRAFAIHRDRPMVLADGKLWEWVDDAGLVIRAPAPGATFIQSAGGILYADVASLREGQELHWFHEAFGLFLSTGDLSPGPGSSSPSPPVALGPTVLFTAWSPETGRQPFAWTPDPLPPTEAPRAGCGCASAQGSAFFAGLVLWAWVRSRAKPRRQ